LSNKIMFGSCLRINLWWDFSQARLAVVTAPPLIDCRLMFGSLTPKHSIKPPNIQSPMFRGVTPKHSSTIFYYLFLIFLFYILKYLLKNKLFNKKYLIFCHHLENTSLHRLWPKDKCSHYKFRSLKIFFQLPKKNRLFD